MCLRVHTFKHEYLRSKLTDHNKFYLRYHWGLGKAALGPRSDRNRTLVSMAPIAPIGLCGHSSAFIFHYANMPMQYSTIFMVVKMIIFRCKNVIFF